MAKDPIIMTCRPGRRKIALLSIYMLLILALSLIPMHREIRGLEFLINMKSLVQNLMHIPFYAFLAILWLQILRIYAFKGWKTVLFVAFFSVGFGIVIEFIQMTIPGRYPSIIDMGLNTIGTFVGILIYLMVERNGSGFIRRMVCE